MQLSPQSVPPALGLSNSPLAVCFSGVTSGSCSLGKSPTSLNVSICPCSGLCGFHRFTQGTHGLDLSTTTIVGEKNLSIHLALNHTPWLSRSGLRMDGEVVAKRVNVCEGKTQVRLGVGEKDPYTPFTAVMGQQSKPVGLGWQSKDCPAGPSPSPYRQCPSLP